MGLTSMEAEVMALWDGGMSTRMIVQATGHKRNKVEAVVTSLATGNEQRRANLAIAAGSAALLAAIQQARISA